MGDIERIIVVILWSSLRENWSIRVMSSVIPALQERFWKLVMYCWKSLSKVPSGRLMDL